jgi:TP901 family phage tail tape measure protein
MSVGDFQVKVGGDFSEVLRGFQQLPQEAAKAGQGLEKGLSNGVAGAGNRISEINSRLGALIKEIGTLNNQRATLKVDSSEYVEAGKQLEALRAERTELSREKTLLKVDASDAPAAANQFRLLDGVVQGIAFSLSNTLTNAAGAALQAVSSIPRTISQFDTARAAVSTLGVNTDELGRNLANLSRELNNNVSQVELMEAAYDVASSGFSDAASNTEVMRAAALLATGGFTDLQTAGDGLTSVLNAYGLSAEDATKVTDSIIQTQNDGKIVAGEYAREIGRLAPTAKASGVSLEELNAAISGATAQGVPVGSTFAGIQQAIVSILKPSQDASKYAKELGIEWNASALQAKGLGGFLQQLVEKGAASSESIIRLTGSTEAQTALMPLLNDGLEKYNQFLDNQRTSAGAAASASEKATATIDGSLKRLQNTISNLTVETFKGLAPIVSGSINAITGFVEAIAAVPGPLKALAGVLLGLPSAYLAVKLAVMALNTELIKGQIATAIAGFQQLTTLLKTQFITDLATAKAAWAAFTTSVQTGALQQQIGALTAKFGPLALAIGAVVFAVDTYNRSTADSRSIAESAAAGQDRLTAALVKAGVETGELTSLGGPFARAMQDNTDALSALLAPLQGIPSIGPLVVDALKAVANAAQTAIPGLKGATEAVTFLFNKWRETVANANQTQGLEQAAIALLNLQQEAINAENAAGKLFAELKAAGGPPNTEQTEQIKNLTAALEEARGNGLELAKQFEALAAAARNSGNKEYADELLRLAEAARQGNTLTDARIKQLQSLLPATQASTAATQADTEAQKRAQEATKARAQAEAELNQIIATAPVRNLEAQLAVGQQLVGLSQALADREQSRFAVVKAGLEFELAGAEKRGASEAQIGAIKKQIQELDRQALQARFQALQQEQQLQIKMLELSQQKARLEADLSVQEQRAEILKAQVELQKAQASGSQAEIAAASAQVELQQAILGIKTQQQNTLKQTQPIEAAILGLQQETAINGERAKAAQMGYRFEANGSLVAINALAGAADRVGVVTANSVTEQARLTSVAQQTGLAIERAADGSFVLGRSQQDVTRATEALNRQLDGSATAAGKTADAAGGIGDAVSNASSPADDIASAFISTSGTAPKAAQGARNFAGWLSGAKTFGEQIANLPLVNQMGEVANRTQSAANAAKVFYDWLERASRLPGSRWTGGPVDAGEQYRVNELGQEALLAGGRLSLINAAPNSLWRAPANGTVIPAGITSRLQEQGALPGRAGAALPMGGGGSNAALAVEVGKLRQEVGELARKQWNVNISTKTGPTGSQVLKQMLR